MFAVGFELQFYVFSTIGAFLVCFPTAPGRVQSLSISQTTSPSELDIEWDEQILNNCPTSLYHVEYELINEDQCLEIIDPIRFNDNDTTETSTTITGLKAYSTYRVFITAENEAGKGLSEVIEGTTNETGKDNR